MNTESKNFIAELAQLGAELKRDKITTMSPLEQKMNSIAHRLLQLERDLAVPGAGISDSSRQQRILEMMQDEDF